MLWQDQAGQMQIKVVLIGWKSPPAALSLEGGGTGLEGCPALSETKGARVLSLRVIRCDG